MNPAPEPLEPMTKSEADKCLAGLYASGWIYQLSKTQLSTILTAMPLTSEEFFQHVEAVAKGPINS